MRIYLDVSCLNRPYDDQGQVRIRLEAEATTAILGKCERGEWQQVSSEMARIEIDAMPDADRRARVHLLLPDPKLLLKLTDSTRGPESCNSSASSQRMRCTSPLPNH